MNLNLYKPLQCVSPCGQKKVTVRYEDDYIGSSDSYYTDTVIELHHDETNKTLLWVTNYSVNDIHFTPDGNHVVVHGPHYKDLTTPRFDFNCHTGVGILSID